jgi:hypothetical protein
MQDAGFQSAATDAPSVWHRGDYSTQPQRRPWRWGAHQPWDGLWDENL